MSFRMTGVQSIYLWYRQVGCKVGEIVKDGFMKSFECYVKVFYILF